MKKVLLKFMMLLCLLFIGMGAWADKITDYTNIVSGQRYRIGATTSSTDYYLKVDGSSTATGVTGTAVTSSSEATVFVFEGSGTSWTIKFYGTSNYLSLASSKANGKVNIVSTASKFTLSNQSNKIRISIGDYSVQKNNSLATIGSYGNTQTDVWLEPVSSGSGPVDASWSVSSSPVSVRATKTARADITTNYDGSLSVSSNNTNVATATINGKVITVTGVAEGSTTLNVTGAVTSNYNAISKTINVTVTPNVTTPGTYSITPNNAFWGTSYNGSISSVTANSLTFNGESDDITVQLKNGTSTNGYINDVQTRVYNGYTMKFNVPTGYDITAIAFTAGDAWAGTHTASVGTMTNNKNWTGAANEVTINFKGTCQINSVSVTYAVHVAPSATYTVTFDAGSNGTCSTSELAEASAGAGVTLPGVTANTGWDFVGWSTSATPSSANAGVAGATYYPTADCTLYAYYKKQMPSFSGAFIDFDLSTDNTATATENEMTWVNSVVNIAAAKASSTTAANNYYPGSSGKSYTSTRFYTNSTLTFTPVAGVTITGIEFTTTTDGYATAFENSTWTNGDAVANATNKIAYITPTNGTQAVSTTIGGTTGGTKFRVYYTCPNFNITTADTDFYSLYIDRAVTIPSNVTAYTGSLEGNTLTLTQIEGGTIPANTGVVFKTTEAGTATFVAAAGVDPIANNDIKGVVVDTPVANVEAGAGNVVLVLGVVDGNVCFAKPNTSTLGANKAYIIAPSSAAKGIRMVVNGETTGINTIEIVKANNISYNLNGQRVNANAKGIVIVNGRKYINK